jgi:hypothetical protein
MFLKPLLRRGWGGQLKTPPFLEAGFCIINFNLQVYPPPCIAGIIITTTITSEVMSAMILLTLLSIKDVVL